MPFSLYCLHILASPLLWGCALSIGAPQVNPAPRCSMTQFFHLPHPIPVPFPNPALYLSQCAAYLKSSGVLCEWEGVSSASTGLSLSPLPAFMNVVKRKNPEK